MKIKLCESQITAVVIEEMKRWHKRIKINPTEKGDKELMKAFREVYEFYTGTKLK